MKKIVQGLSQTGKVVLGVSSATVVGGVGLTVANAINHNDENVATTDTQKSEQTQENETKDSNITLPSNTSGVLDTPIEEEIKEKQENTALIDVAQTVTEEKEQPKNSTATNLLEDILDVEKFTMGFDDNKNTNKSDTTENDNNNDTTNQIPELEIIPENPEFPLDVYSENTTQEITEIPFETIYVDNENIPEGQEVVTQEGFNGYEINDYQIKYVNGVETEKTLIKTEKKDPQNKIIQRGIGKEEVAEIPELPIVDKDQTQPITEEISYTENFETEVQEIEYKTIYEEDYNLPEGETYVKQEGKKGYYSNTIKVTYANGVETNREIVSQELHESEVNEIIVVGKKPANPILVELPNDKESVVIDVVEDVVRTEARTETEIIPYETQRIEDPTLEVGSERIHQIGINGNTIRTYEDKYVNDVLTESTEVGLLETAPVTEIIYVGTKIDNKGTVTDEVVGLPGAEVTTITEYEEVENHLDPIIVEDDTKPIGYQQVVVEGQPQITKKTYTVTKVNDVETERILESEEITQEAVQSEIIIGTKSTVKTTKTTQESIPYTTFYQEDPNMYVGEEKVIQEGEDGVRTIITEYDTFDGVDSNPVEISNEITKDPTNKIIVRGTKDPQSDVIDLSTTHNTSATSGLYVGATTSEGRIVKNMIINYDHSLEEINAMSEEEQYELAQEDYTNTMDTYTADSPNNIITSGIPLSKGGMDYINNNIDYNLVNKYFIELVNKERMKYGYGLLTYDPQMQQGADTRALEQAEIGNLVSDGVPHQRPNGTKFFTAFEYLRGSEVFSLSENVAQFGTTNWYQLMNERFLAERLFEQWKRSPGHYGIMTSKKSRYVSISVKVGLQNNIQNQYADLYTPVIGVAVFR